MQSVAGNQGFRPLGDHGACQTRGRASRLQDALHPLMYSYGPRVSRIVAMATNAGPRYPTERSHPLPMRMRMQRIDPINRFRLLRRRDVEIDYDRLLAAAH